MKEQNMTTKHIGGSILPSSSDQILQPMPFGGGGGTLQVIPDYESDTHHLQLNGETIATHPNGYSCRSLAERIIAGDAKRIQEQAQYIVDCGGSCDARLIAGQHFLLNSGPSQVVGRYLLSEKRAKQL